MKRNKNKNKSNDMSNAEAIDTVKRNVKKGIIRKKYRRSYRRSIETGPTIKRKQVEFLADVSLAVNFKRKFFRTTPPRILGKLKQLMVSMYEAGYTVAGGQVL